MKRTPLHAAELTGRVLHPGDPGWEGARRGFARWADYDTNQPRAVVFCQDSLDVAHAVRWARQNGVPVRVRSGRHSYEAYSSLVKDGLIIDVSEIDFVRASREREVAEIGPGIDMLDLFESLGEVGLTVPGATGPTVGLGGLTLGGGFGVTSRKWGLACDNLVDVELVTAKGEIIHANERENPDLFWACRGGGGGNFGIATSFTFRVHPVSNVAIYTIHWSWDQFETVVGRWQDWAPQVDDGLSSALRLTATREISMYGQFTAEDRRLPEISALLAPMIEVAPPIAVNLQILPHVPGTRAVLGVDPMHPQWWVHRHSDDQIFKSTSALAHNLFPVEAIRLLKSGLETVPSLECAPSQPSMIQLLGGGGAVGRVPPDATAVVHRQVKFVVQYDAYWTAPVDGNRSIAWITALRDSLRPYTRGAYVNYVDDSLKDWLHEYYGDNLKRLVEVKRRYDPDNFFRFPQSIPTSL